MKQNGIIIPVETLITKYREKDYRFFLEQKNFNLVADSLEKFKNCLDLKSPEAKEFILFKKKLYNAYEVYHRSSNEHDLFSSDVTSAHIYHMQESNFRHIEEMRKINHLERLQTQLTLQGKVYQRKFLSHETVEGVLSFGLAFGLYKYSALLTPIIGTFIPSVLTAGSVMWGFMALANRNYVDSIQILDKGDNKGKIEVSVAMTPIKRAKILVSPEDISRQLVNKETETYGIII